MDPMTFFRVLTGAGGTAQYRATACDSSTCRATAGVQTPLLPARSQ
jgi:hypothetical protein